MNGNRPDRLTIVWIALLLATVAGFGTAGLHSSAGLAFVIVMLVAAFKARLVIRHFMDLRLAPRPWRWAFDGLVAAATCVIIGFHLAALAG
nr:cytochrome C oxidase subunit IV family protein [Novosphingobium lentum]